MRDNGLAKSIRRIAWKVLGSPPATASDGFGFHVDTHKQRRDLIDLALVHWQIAARRSGESVEECAPDFHYAEFGVFRGDTFAHVCKRGPDLHSRMRYYAFDSFEGLPEPEGVDAGAEFSKGQFACDRETFESTLQERGVDLDRVEIIQGWFEDSLVAYSDAPQCPARIAIAYIDCDLYSSTVPVLEFLTPRISQGAILFFDDWYCFGARPDRGVQLAVSEWLSRNPHISLIPWQPFSHHGHAFFVNLDLENVTANG